MPDRTTEILERLQREPIVRTFAVDREAVNEEDRTVEVAFASDQPIEHWFGMLALSMDKKAMRSERLKSGAPLLMDHNTRDLVGVVESHSIGTDGIARATVRFSKSVRGEEVFTDVREGIRRCISVGFMVYAMDLEKREKGKPDLYRCDDWEPYEISLVAVPADISVGVGRDKQAAFQPLEFSQPGERAISTNGERTMPNETIETPVAPVVETPAIPAQRSVLERTREIVAFAEIFGQADMARTMIAASPDVTVDDVRAAIRSAQPPTAVVPPPPVPQVQLARTLPRYGTLRNFVGEGSAERAYRFGQWFLAVRGIDKATAFCRENGIVLSRAQQEGVNEAGGFLVPEEFGNDLIDLREQYGVFRREAKMVPMASDTRSDPRRTGGLTAYFVAESGAGTASDKSWDRVSLTAKKLMVLARYSSEVNEDAVINMGDDLAGEIAYAFAVKEDNCGFIGDGSSTYGGMQGVCTKIKGLSGTIANIAGLVVATGTGYASSYGSAVLTDFEAVVGKLPVFADTQRAKWYMHKSFYWNVAAKLVLAAGGVTGAEIEGSRMKRLLGYEVEFVQAMPKSPAVSQVCALLGDLSLAASFGSRRDTNIAVSEHSRFANDEIEIKGTERFDINVHDVGNASATAGSRVEGPIVGLITAAS
jgi:HK97 family phage major capsid protein